MADFHQIRPRNVIWYPLVESWKTFSNIFTPEVICCQNLSRKSVKQAPHSEQAIGHGMYCREILFTPRCSPRAREFQRSVNFFVRRMVAKLLVVKVAQFSNFCLFSPYKTPKTTFRWPAYSPGITWQNDYDTIFSCGSRRSKGVPSGSEVSCNFW